MAKYRIDQVGGLYKVSVTYRDLDGHLRTSSTLPIIPRPAVRKFVEFAAKGMDQFRKDRRKVQVQLHEPTSNEVA